MTLGISAYLIEYLDDDLCSSQLIQRIGEYLEGQDREKREIGGRSEILFMRIVMKRLKIILMMIVV